MTLPPRDDATALRRFLLALPRAKGESESLGAIYARYLLWCQHEHLAALDVEDFRHKFEAEASRLGIRTRKQKNKVLCLDVKLRVEEQELQMVNREEYAKAKRLLKTSTTS